MKKYLKLIFLGISDEHSDEREIEIKYKTGFVAFNLMCYLSLARFWYNIFKDKYDFFDLIFVAIIMGYIFVLIRNNVLLPSLYNLKQKKKYILVMSGLGLVIAVGLAFFKGMSAIIGGIIGGTLTIILIYGGSLFYEIKVNKELDKE